MRSNEEPKVRGDWIACAGVVVAVALLWSPLLGLPFSGEDYPVLARAKLGGSMSSHVVRPIADGWIAVLHAIFGADSAMPFHAGSLALHLVSTTLVFALMRALVDETWSAALAAFLFGTGVAACDSLAWIVDCTRPLSGLFALIALLGIVRVLADKRGGVLLTVSGLLAQGLSNEEVFGTAALCLLVFVRAPGFKEDYKRIGIVIAIIAGLLVRRVAAAGEGQVDVPGLRVDVILDSVTTRAQLIAEGIGLPMAAPWLGLLVPIVGCTALALRGRRQAAWILGAFWVMAYVPFFLSHPSRYRFYPSLAPTACLVAGALMVPRAAHQGIKVAVAVVLMAGSVVATHADRVERIQGWASALEEIETCAHGARELAASGADSPPPLVNLDVSMIGPFTYYFGVTNPEAFLRVHFLDGASGFAPFENAPAGPWWGRRLDGTFGSIEPERYLARPELPTLQLAGEAVLATSLEDALAKLADPAVDLTRTPVLEADASAWEPLSSDVSEATVEVWEPLEQTGRKGRMIVKVEAPQPLLLVHQAHWLFDVRFRASKDQALVTDRTERRKMNLTARAPAKSPQDPSGKRREYAVFRANAYAHAVLVPAGKHTIQLEWTVRSGNEDS